MTENPGIPLNKEWLQSVRINLPAVNRRAETLPGYHAMKGHWRMAWLLRAITCVDLTTLAGDDTDANVFRLCYKGVRPVREDIVKAMGIEMPEVGAICVYPARVSDAVEALKKFQAPHIPVAAVATGFPTGQYSLETRLGEIRYAVSCGAREIDIVINRPMVIKGDWEGLYGEVKSMKEACGPDVHMKSILAVGELGTMKNVYKASLVCMMAGSDFIKTSTGKEAVNATLPVGIVMARAIRDYHERTGYTVGFKPAGGIRTSQDAINWLILIKEELGNKWLNNGLFRIGASGLLTDIEKQFYHYAYGKYPAVADLPT